MRTPDAGNEHAGPRPPRLLRRILAAQVIVVLAAAASLGTVAAIIAPPIFRDHVRRAMGPVSPEVARHLDEALRETLLMALAVGIIVSMVVAAAVAWSLARRLARPVEQLSLTAERLAAGEFEARAPWTVSTVELTRLTTTFNTLAEALETTERTRHEQLGDLAHELRTPLATIEGYHEGLRDGVFTCDSSTLDVLHQATSRLRRLIDDLAVVSRAEAGVLDIRTVRLDLRAVVSAVVGASRPAADGAGVTLEGHTPAHPIEVIGDADRLAQAIGNLITNAVAHTRPGGRIEVEATLADVDERPSAVITVRDSGAGIAPEHLPHVFQRFYRADPARHRPVGTGLGLTICRAIVLRHNGSVTAQSPGIGLGSTFTIRLPLA